MLAERRRTREHPVRWELIEESFEDAEFLWRFRAGMLRAGEQTIRAVERVAEERLLGCCDGVLVGGRRALEVLVEPALRSGIPARVSVSAYVLASSEHERAWPALHALLREASGDELANAVRGVALSSLDIKDRMSAAELEASPLLHAAVLTASAIQQRDPGPDALDAIHHEDEGVRCAALQAARYLPPSLAQQAVRAGLALRGPSFEAAVESGIALALPAAEAACRDAARRTDASPAMRALHALIDPAGAFEGKQSDVGVLWLVGTLEAADTCVALARSADAALALESFCAMTGAPSTLFAQPPTSDDESDEVQLPPPDASALQHWWHANRKCFVPGLRYLAGQPRSVAIVLEALIDQPTRRREALAQMLAWQTRGSCQLNTRTWCRAQRARITGYRAQAAAWS